MSNDDKLVVVKNLPYELGDQLSQPRKILSNLKDKGRIFILEFMFFKLR